jgi:hypothetical protein
MLNRDTSHAVIYFTLFLSSFRVYTGRGDISPAPGRYILYIVSLVLQSVYWTWRPLPCPRTVYTLHCVSLPSECILDVATTPLPPGEVSCLIPAPCTEVHCCVGVASVDASFSTYLLLDPCDNTLTVGIEKLNYSLSLHSYNSGKWSLSY